MKKIFLTSVALLLIATSSAYASIKENFTHKSTIEIPTSLSKLYRVPFTTEMYQNISSAQNIRIYKNNEKEVPFFIQTNTDTKINTVNKSVLSILNTVNNTNSTTYIIDVHNTPLTSFFIDTAQNDFRKVVDVYGSHLPNSRFQRLTSNIGDVIYKENSLNKKISVSFKRNSYRYLKVTVSKSGGELQNLSFYKTKNNSYIAKQSDEIIEPVLTQEKKGKETHILIDLQKNKRAVHKLLLSLENTEFDRTVSIYTSNSKKAELYTQNTPRKKSVEYWQQIATGSLFNKHNYTKNTLSFSPTTKRFILLVIHNGNNTPLTIESAKAYAKTKSIFIENAGAGTYSLYFGNKNIDTPSYDIHKITTQNDKDNAPQVTATNATNNTEYIPPVAPLSEQSPYLFPLILLFVGAMLGFLLFRAFKK